MYTVVDFDTPGVHGFEVGAKVTAEDYDRFAQEIRQAVDEHGTIRLLLRVSGLPATDMTSAAEPLRFVYEHQAAVERVAVVADNPVIAWLVRLGDSELAPALRRFGLDEDDAARRWLTE